MQSIQPQRTFLLGIQNAGSAGTEKLQSFHGRSHFVRRVFTGYVIIAIWIFTILSIQAEERPINYPYSHRIDHVDVHHGMKVADPYRWLENDVRESKAVEKWVTQQNKVTFSYLQKIPERDKIRKRLTELWNYEKFTSPAKHGAQYYFYKNNGLQNQSVLYSLENLDGNPNVLIDPNTWSKDGTVALSGTSFSETGKYLAYGLAEAGSDWQKWRVLEIATRKVLEDELKWVKFSDISWTKDDKGFFYCRYDKPKNGFKFQSINYNQKLMYHRVNTPQSADVLVYHRPDQPEWGFSNEVTEDGRYLIITIWKGTNEKYRILYKDLTELYGLPTDLIDNFDHEFTFIDNDGPVFYFKTDAMAPRRRVVAIDIRKPSCENWREILPQVKETLSDVNMVGNMFVARYLKDACVQVKLFAPDGRFIRNVKFTGIGTASGFSGKRTDTETFYSFSSFANPSSIYHYDLITGKSTLFRRPKVKFNPSQYEVNQVFYRSKDGTEVPMFIAHRKDLKLDGNNPTLLYGYGGFNISLTPKFSVSRLVWMEIGGVFVLANLRGGGEYGEEWHLAGTKLNKQNVFNDFIAAAEYLIGKNYTNSKKLAIQGASNGGLLVGAVMTQRPELFGAALPAVGVMDMLRFQEFTAGRFWIDDYGSVNNLQQFKVLYSYSPYHNLKKGMKYPATLGSTADTDDRVVPGHSFKFFARLQHCHVGTAPVLIRIETRAGHGAGKPTTKIIEEVTDKWTFLVKTLGISLK